MAALFSFQIKKRRKGMILTFTNTLSTHSNFPPAFRHLSLFTAIDRSVSFFSISSNSDSRWISSLFIADTSLDNSSVLRRNSFVSDDMVVSIVSPPFPSGSATKVSWNRNTVNLDEENGRGGRKKIELTIFLLPTLSFCAPNLWIDAWIVSFRKEEEGERIIWNALL